MPLSSRAMRTTCLRSLLILFCAAAAPQIHAEAPRQLTWGDLTPRLTPDENPFAGRTVQQLEALIDIAAVRDRKARGATVSPQEVFNEWAATAKLQHAGIDVDGLLARRNELGEKQRGLANAANPALDGGLVRLSGYLLPLEFSGKHVTEFLLVPWVGACIHAPLPPPNQIVHVRLEKAFEMRGMFDPVSLTGRIAASATKKSVYIMDGSAEIDIGYSMRAGQVEPYKQ
jgi:uncharacterized protein